MERLLGLKGFQCDPSQARATNVVSTQAELNRKAAIDRVRVVLAALGKDLRRNRLPLYAPLKLKITCGGDVVRCEQTPVVLEDGRTYRPSADHITFSWDHCQSNEQLAQALCRRPNRGFPCARCQVYGTSFFACRVQQGHSNPDFNLLQNFQGDHVGGVRGLLDPLMSEPSNQASSVAACMSTGDARETDELGKTTATAESIDEQKLADSKAPAATEMKKDEPGSEQKATATKSSAIVRVQHSQKVERNSSTKSELQKKLEDTFDQKEEDHDEEDPNELLKKAKIALNLATELHRDAEVQSNLPVRLSEEFITTTFPFDPTDDHYMYCIICGISGDLLCCDGCSNVVHPSCVGLGEIPEDDWFCEKCAKRKNSGTRKQSKTQNTEAKDENENETSKPILDLDGRNEPIGGRDSDVVGSGTASSAGLSENEIIAGRDAHTESRSASERPETEKPSIEEKPGLVEQQDEDLSVQTDDKDEEIYLRSIELDKLLEDLEPKAKATPVLSVNDDRGIKQPAPGAQLATKADDQTSAEHLISNVPTNHPMRDGRGAVAPVSNELKIGFPIGTELIKNFEEFGDFKGQVAVIPTASNPFYLVRYEDGDEEELDAEELERYVVRKPEPPPQQPPPPKQSVDKEDLPNKKRGRPRKSELGDPSPTPQSPPPTKKKKEIEFESEETCTETTYRPIFDVLAEVSKLAEDEKKLTSL